MKNSSNTLIGAVFIVIGAALLLDQLSIPFFGDTPFISLVWPLILLVVGIFFLSKSKMIAGWIFILLGILFGLSQVLTFNVAATFWPIILIGVGLLLLYRKTKGVADPHVSEGVSSSDTLNETAIFSGIKRIVQTKNFHGGEVLALFGGVEIDLREVELHKDGATLNVTAIFGGATITVSDAYRIDSSGTPILGGWDNKFSAPADTTKPVLRIHGTAIFGGVEIKNKA